MPTVAVNAPKTPVTKGSNGVAMATLPNICKMPGPPAPFVPIPLPNIGTSDNGPKGYSTSVTIEGSPVAIQGSSFLSTGDIAAMGTGGGIVSMNVQGPTTFLGPGSLDVQIEGKNVQLLGDPMLNNCGPTGSPANSATMAGVLQLPLLMNAIANDSLLEIQHICDVICEVKAEGGGQTEISKRLAAEAPLSNIKPEVPFVMNPGDGQGPSPVMSKKDPSRATTNWRILGSRRPDAILVDKSADPWRGDNIKAVVEIKLGNDDWGPGQQEAYEDIAGDKSKLILVTDGPDGCRCSTDNDNGDPIPVPVEEEEKQQTTDEQDAPLLSPGWVHALEAVVAVAAVVATAALVVAALPVEVPVAAGVALVAGAAALAGSGAGPNSS